MTTKNKTYTKQEIIEKLLWFHGEEINKYPLNEDLLKVRSTENTKK